MQVYLPEDVYRLVKELGLPASELLQSAVRIEARRRRLLEATDEYLSELIAEVGQPTPEEAAEADALVLRLAGRHDLAAS